MTYSSVVTSKGTITLPAELRRKLWLVPGTRVQIIQNQQTSRLEINAAPSIQSIRATNKAIMQKAGTWPPKPYKSGDGFTAHVQEKYGSHKRLV